MIKGRTSAGFRRTIIRAPSLVEKISGCLEYQFCTTHGRGVRSQFCNVELALVEALLSRGADIHARNKSGETALHRASARPPVVEVLLRNGARVDECDGDGRTPLIRASIGWEIESVKLLLDAGAAVNAADKQGLTPLMYAAGYGEAAMVRLLLERGGDPNIRAKSGESALDLAKQFDPAQQPKQCNYEEVVRLLENWKPK